MAPDAKMLQFTVNQTPYTLPEVPGEKLSDLLRIHLGLTGTKIGCGERRCGNCTVMVDGKPTHSCLIRASKIDSSSVALNGDKGIELDSAYANIQGNHIYNNSALGFDAFRQIDQRGVTSNDAHETDNI